MSLLHVATLPKLTSAQWRQVESFLDEWKRDVLAAAKRHPTKGFQLGVEQTEAFLRLLGHLGTHAATGFDPFDAGQGPSGKAGVEWANRYTLRELDDSLNVYIGHIKDALLYGLRGAVNPSQLAAWLYKATQDAEVNWRTIARTEMVRANAAGRLHACRQMGYAQVWAPPHVGACKHCRTKLENQVFDLDQVEHITNFGQPDPEQWLACIPLHPHCRHCWLPYVPAVYDEMQRQQQLLADNGLSDAKLDEMFDSSGQLNPEYQDAVDWDQFKTVDGLIDPYGRALADAVTKVSVSLPSPTSHHRLFEDGKLRPQVDARIAHFLSSVLVQAVANSLDVFLSGPAVTPSHMPPVERPQAHLGVVVDYAQLRRLEPAYAPLSDPELHAAITTALHARLADSEPIPGVQLTGHVDSGTSHAAYTERARHADRPTWSLTSGDWAYAPTSSLTALADTPPGVDPVDAAVNPDWLTDARAVVQIVGDMVQTSSTIASTLGIPPQVSDGMRDAYNQLRDASAGGKGRFVWDYATAHGQLALLGLLTNHGDLATVFPAYTWAPVPLDVVKAMDPARASTPVAGPSAGTEHWITIHPHGDDEKGIPVLIRENGDGTASVIGGAGGHLTMLRIDRSKRIKPTKGAEPGDNKDLGPIETPISEEEANRQHEQLQADRQSAQQTIEHVKTQRDDVKTQLSTLIQQRFPDHDWEGMDGEARRKLVTKLRRDSLRTLAHGAIDRKDVNAAPEDLHPEDHVADLEGGQRETPDDQAGEPGDRQANLRPQTAMTDEDAQALQELFEQDRRLGKVASQARKVIGGNNKGSSAWQMDWRPHEITAAVAKKVEAEQRTQIARDLLTTADNSKNGAEYKRATHQGAFDTMDAVSYAILGHSVLTREVSELLGAAGCAQLIAHHLAQQVKAQKLDPRKIGEALNAITDDRERKVMDLGLARVQDRMARVQEARDELAATKTGDSDYTTSMAIALQFGASKEALKQLGGMIGGLEAMSGLKTALKPYLKGKGEKFEFAGSEGGGKITVGGFATPGRIKELAAKAKIKVHAGDISGERGDGNYTLKLDPDRLGHLLTATENPKAALLAQLRDIRTADQFDSEVQSQRHGPGMSQTLDHNQAKGKMFLEAAGSGILAFDPGVGKTHTAIASAMDLMASEPDKHHRALIVCPANMLQSWAKTIKDQHSAHSVQIVNDSNKLQSGAKLDATVPKGGQQMRGENACDFNIVSYESLDSVKHELGSLGHTITIADELQKAKNEKTGRYDNLQRAIQSSKPEGRAFWGLSGTPIEKDVGDLHSMTSLARLARGEHGEDHKLFRERHATTGQDQHIARTDKIAQFREGVDDSMFRLTAKDAGNGLAEPDREEHKVTLSPEHRAALRAGVQNVNARSRYAQNQRAEEGELQARSKTTDEGQQAKHDAKISQLQQERSDLAGQHKNIEKPVSFGGRQELLDTLYNHPSGTLQKSIADAIEKSGSFDFKGMPKPDNPTATYEKGDHGGSYEHKHVIFSDKVKPLKAMQKELEARGIKVFVSHGESVGSGGSPKNQANIRDFLAHKGKAVFISSDMNNAGVSLQFGDNSGNFQHGATHMHHLTLPLNNATIQQREARILRKGAAAKVKYHTYSADTPYERKDREQLERERRTQDLAGNSEQFVADEKPARQHLQEHGIDAPVDREGQHSPTPIHTPED